MGISHLDHWSTPKPKPNQIPDTLRAILDSAGLVAAITQRDFHSMNPKFKKKDSDDTNHRHSNGLKMCFNFTLHHYQRSKC